MANLNEPQATIRRNFRNAKILLIEDNPDHCSLIQMVLRSCMPEVDLLIANTAEEAFSQLEGFVEAKKTLPQLIILDVYIPQREDGWAILKRLKAAASPFRFIPLTLLTQSEQVEDTQMGYNLGANSYVVKPTDFPQWLTYFTTLRQYWWHTVTLPHR